MPYERDLETTFSIPVPHFVRGVTQQPDGGCGGAGEGRGERHGTKRTRCVACRGGACFLLGCLCLRAKVYGRLGASWPRNLAPRKSRCRARSSSTHAAAVVPPPCDRAGRWMLLLVPMLTPAALRMDIGFPDDL